MKKERNKEKREKGEGTKYRVKRKSNILEKKRKWVD